MPDSPLPVDSLGQFAQRRFQQKDTLEDLQRIMRGQPSNYQPTTLADSIKNARGDRWSSTLGD